MNIEEFRNYCLNKKGVTEEFPFDETTLVFKVLGKMFALAGLDDSTTANLKCDPERAIELRELFPDFVFPGYHMNKKHWNTVTIDNSISDREILSWIDHSYDLVVKGLKKVERDQLQ